MIFFKNSDIFVDIFRTGSSGSEQPGYFLRRRLSDEGSRRLSTVKLTGSMKIESAASSTVPCLSTTKKRKDEIRYLLSSFTESRIGAGPLLSMTLRGKRLPSFG